MLKATARIISLLPSPRSSIGWQSLLDIVCRYGCFEDAEILYQHFLKTRHADLLQPVMSLGNIAMADDLFHQTIDEGKLKEEFPAQTLMALSYLGHQQTLPVLMNYYEHVFDIDLTLHETVCMALLNYNCDGYERLLEKQIEKCLSQSLFPDFIVLPVIKTGNTNLVRRLNEHAVHKASPSCCGPILLVMAMSGQQHYELFKSNLLEPGWAVNPFQNNTYFILMGMQALRISIKEIYADWCSALIKDHPNTLHILSLLIQLLECKLKESYNYFIRPLQKNEETFASIYDEIFISKNPDRDDSIFGLLKNYMNTKEDDDHFSPALEITEQLYRIKVEQEIKALYSESEND